LKLQITNILLEGYEIKGYEGLSELLVIGKGWGRKPKEINSKYHREVKKENEKLITVLKKREEK
jgi:hypothetical protein